MPPAKAVAAYLSGLTGLVFSTEQLARLTEFLRGRFSLLHISDPADYIARLKDPAEFLAAVDTLTVKETFFYRHEAQFDAFIKYFLPGLLAKAAEEKRPVRLWSAGCCTGEEPYTLAILAAEAGRLDQVEILGTDINEGYLETALAGVYSRRSVEKLPAAILGKYFKRNKDRFILDERIRAKVSFKYLNLGELLFPSYLNKTIALNAIFCRNVLIYFDKPKLREIVLRFADCLAPGGVLALGHSEMLPRDWPLAAEQAGEAFFYRPRKSVAPARQAPAAVEHRNIRKAVPKPPAAAQTVAPPAGRSLIDKAGKLADAGNSTEAAALCREILRGDPSQARAYYLLGLLELAQPRSALEHFRKTLYLNPGHLQARLHLAQCQERLGFEQDAAREYKNLEKLAGARPAAEVFDAAEGTTYGMLRLISRGALKKFRK